MHGVSVRDAGDGAPVVTLTGDVDQSVVAAVEESVWAAAAGAGRWTLDLGPVAYLDSAGLRMLLDIRNTADATGVSVTIRPPRDGMARRALEITGLDRRLAG